MRNFYVIAAVAAALPVHAAHAQEDAAPPAPAAGGFRAELLVGFDTDGFEEGALYGGRIGYDLPVTRSLLLGIDGELNDVTTDQEFLPGTPVLEDGPDAYIGARATLVLSRRFRIYGGAGYSRARQSFFFLINPAGGPFGPVGGEESYQDGYRLTGGAQFNISRRAFIGAEYRYSNYRSFFQREQLVGSIGFRF